MKLLANAIIFFIFIVSLIAAILTLWLCSLTFSQRGGPYTDPLGFSGFFSEILGRFCWNFHNILQKYKEAKSRNFYGYKQNIQPKMTFWSLENVKKQLLKKLQNGGW